MAANAACCSATEHRPKNVFVATKTNANGPSGRSPAMSPTRTSTRSPPGFAAQPLEHRGRRVDSVHLEPALGERDRELAGADAELEDASAAARLEEERDGRLPFGVHRIPLVVHIGDRVAIALGPVPIHTRILAAPAAMMGPWRDSSR